MSQGAPPGLSGGKAAPKSSHVDGDGWSRSPQKTGGQLSSRRGSMGNNPWSSPSGVGSPERKLPTRRMQQRAARPRAVFRFSHKAKDLRTQGKVSMSVRNAPSKPLGGLRGDGKSVAKQKALGFKYQSLSHRNTRKSVRKARSPKGRFNVIASAMQVSRSLFFSHQEDDVSALGGVGGGSGKPGGAATGLDDVDSGAVRMSEGIASQLAGLCGKLRESEQPQEQQQTLVNKCVLLLEQLKSIAYRRLSVQMCRRICVSLCECLSAAGTTSVSLDRVTVLLIDLASIYFSTYKSSVAFSNQEIAKVASFLMQLVDLAANWHQVDALRAFSFFLASHAHKLLGDATVNTLLARYRALFSSYHSSPSSSSYSASASSSNANNNAAKADDRAKIDQMLLRMVVTCLGSACTPSNAKQIIPVLQGTCARLLRECESLSEGQLNLLSTCTRSLEQCLPHASVAHIRAILGEVCTKTPFFTSSVLWSARQSEEKTAHSQQQAKADVVTIEEDQNDHVALSRVLSTVLRLFETALLLKPLAKDVVALFDVAFVPLLQDHGVFFECITSAAVNSHVRIQAWVFLYSFFFHGREAMILEQSLLRGEKGGERNPVVVQCVLNGLGALRQVSCTQIAEQSDVLKRVVQAYPFSSKRWDVTGLLVLLDVVKRSLRREDGAQPFSAATVGQIWSNCGLPELVADAIVCVDFDLSNAAAKLARAEAEDDLSDYFDEAFLQVVGLLVDGAWGELSYLSLPGGEDAYLTLLGVFAGKQRKKGVDSLSRMSSVMAGDKQMQDKLKLLAKLVSAVSNISVDEWLALVDREIADLVTTRLFQLAGGATNGLVIQSMCKTFGVLAPYTLHVIAQDRKREDEDPQAETTQSQQRKNKHAKLYESALGYLLRVYDGILKRMSASSSAVSAVSSAKLQASLRARDAGLMEKVVWAVANCLDLQGLEQLSYASLSVPLLPTDQENKTPSSHGLSVIALLAGTVALYLSKPENQLATACAQAVRAIGAICASASAQYESLAELERQMEEEDLMSTMAASDDSKLLNVREFGACADVLESVLLSQTTDVHVKVKWNACTAAGKFFASSTQATAQHTDLIRGLLRALQVDSNFKVRIQAATALQQLLDGSIFVSENLVVHLARCLVDLDLSLSTAPAAVANNNNTKINAAQRTGSQPGEEAKMAGYKHNLRSVLAHTTRVLVARFGRDTSTLSLSDPECALLESMR